MTTEKKIRIIYFLQSFVVSKPFKGIVTDFLLKKTKIEKFNFLRGEGYIFNCLKMPKKSQVNEYSD